MDACQKKNSARSPKPMICISRHFARTVSRTVLRPGSGQSGLDDALYVRGYNGVESRWYQAALQQKAGRINVARITKEVAFEPVNDRPTNDRIDEAYRAKYTKSLYLKPMISARARAATITVAPR